MAYHLGAQIHALRRQKLLPEYSYSAGNLDARCCIISRQKEENDSRNPDTLSRGSYSNSRRVAIQRAESVGGTVLCNCAVLALVLANTPHPPLCTVCEAPLLARLSPASTTESIGTWAAGLGLLVVFFFLGLELKRIRGR